MKIIKFSFIALMLLCVSIVGQAQLRAEINKIVPDAKGIVGISILNVETRDTFSYNANARLVLQSVMKLPIALAVLHRVDQGKLKLDQKLHIIRDDLPKTYSPLRDKYPDGIVDVSIADLLSYMVSLSDNDACDILLSKVASKDEVEKYMRELGIQGMAIRASEAEMAARWEVQYTNWARPAEITRLIELTWQGKVLKKPTQSFLWKLLEETSTGAKRLKGLLPAGTVVAHKTGTSGTNDEGLSPATNDAGMITLPNGQHLIITVFVCNSKANMDTREAVIARIAKAAYNHWSK